ncbi:hypothetical protein BCR44DRAFT_1253601 [Catenaria anguillulae PL171]|uniref:Uncharacterized protein n=1 Tax=Catenaria anguillulae PL171 TaxID=765915 RepID=A0A1Y2HC78_9FUNG|nr:hypothetical protein BCR44DRAFT_1253601 [Catenaria anguillulae PL171]
MASMSLPDPSQSYLTLLPLRCPKTTLTLSPTHPPTPATILTHIQLLQPSHLSALLVPLKRQAALNAFLDGFAGCPSATTGATRVMAVVYAGAPELAVDVWVQEKRLMVKTTFMDDGVWRVTVVSDGQPEQGQVDGQAQGEDDDEGRRQERVDRMEKVLNTVGRLELWARWLLECL